MFLAQHPVTYSAIRCVLLQNESRTENYSRVTQIIPMNSRLITMRSVPQMVVQSAKRLPKKQKRRKISTEQRLLVIDHRGTPSSRPTSFKHSLANTRSSNDKWYRFEPASVPVVIVLAVAEACVGLPLWLIWAPATRFFSLPAAGLQDVARLSAAIHQFGEFRSDLAGQLVM